MSLTWGEMAVPDESEIQRRKGRTAGVCSLCHSFQQGIEKHLPPEDHHVTKTLSAPNSHVQESQREILVSLVPVVKWELITS